MHLLRALRSTVHKQQLRRYLPLPLPTPVPLPLRFTAVVVVVLLDAEVVDVGPVLVGDDDHGLVGGVPLEASDGLPVAGEARER